MLIDGLLAVTAVLEPQRLFLLDPPTDSDSDEAFSVLPNGVKQSLVNTDLLKQLWQEDSWL